VTEKGTAGQVQSRRLAQQAGQDGYWLLARLDEPTTPKTLATLPAVATLRTVWAQQFVTRATESTQVPPTAVEFAETVASGAATISTPHDPAARYSEKRGVAWVGYKVQVTESVEPELPRIITDIQTTAAPVADVQQVPVIQTALEHRALVPAQHIVDMAYVSGKTIATSAAHGIELIGPVRPDTSPQAHLVEGVTASQFTLDEAHRQAQCPAGHTSVLWSETTDHAQPVIHIGFAAATCAACPCYARCVTGHPPKPRGRRLKLRAFHAQVYAQREKQTQEAFKHMYRKRAGVEATLSVMVRTQGLRRTRYVGLFKTHLRNMFIAVARNIQRVTHWWAGKRPKHRGRRTVALTIKSMAPNPSVLV